MAETKGNTRVVQVEFAAGHDGARCHCGTTVESGRYTLEIPENYDADAVTAEDLVHDPAVVMLREGWRTTKVDPRWGNEQAWLRAVEKAYRAGNDAGEGFAVGLPDEDGDVAIGDVNELADELGERLVASTCDAEPAIYWDGERLVAVGDSHGPWAVDVTEAVAAARKA